MKEVVLPSTLREIGDSAFSGTQLKDITLPTSVTAIGRGAFGSIDSLSSVVIPKNLSNAYGAFEGSQHLKTIHFEEGITKIAGGLFDLCRNLFQAGGFDGDVLLTEWGFPKHGEPYHAKTPYAHALPYAPFTA